VVLVHPVDELGIIREIGQLDSWLLSVVLNLNCVTNKCLFSFRDFL
jgi:hypothetical protein